MSGKPGQGRGIRPHTWITGPDPVRHDQYLAFLRQRAQANYRSEPWHLTFDDFVQLWSPGWHSRGRHSEDLCMSRRDSDGAWSRSNCVIMTRRCHVQGSVLIKQARGLTVPKHRRIPAPE